MKCLTFCRPTALQPLSTRTATETPGRRRRHGRIIGAAAIIMAAALGAGDDPRPGLRNIDWQSALSVDPVEMKLVEALKQPLIDAMDVNQALDQWFAGRLAHEQGDRAAAAQAWRDGLGLLNDLKPLPKPAWGPPPDANLDILHKLAYPGMDGVSVYVVRWVVDNLTQYGVMVVPGETPAPAGTRHPLLLYMHGAAFGIPLYALPWLARIAREGYVIVGPAMRGEDLFAVGYTESSPFNYKSEGEIENLDGEVNDALSMVAAARKLPVVAPRKFGIIGHSFGAGAGLLVTTRSTDVACMVSYDAWLTNPFRYYWDRMRRGANNWLSWAAYCNQPVAAQLKGLMKRSIVHQAENVNCPLLMFIGGAYEGSVFHLSHADLIRELQRHRKDYVYDVVPNGGHNFVLYYDEAPATYAYAKHMAFLRRHLPPAPPAAAARHPQTTDKQAE